MNNHTILTKEELDQLGVYGSQDPISFVSDWRIKQLLKVEREQGALKEEFLGLLDQHCSIYDRKTNKYVYDSMCLSANEGALALALELGWLKKEQVIR